MAWKSWNSNTFSFIPVHEIAGLGSLSVQLFKQKNIVYCNCVEPWIMVCDPHIFKNNFYCTAAILNSAWCWYSSFATVHHCKRLPVGWLSIIIKLFTPVSPILRSVYRATLCIAQRVCARCLSVTIHRTLIRIKTVWFSTPFIQWPSHHVNHWKPVLASPFPIE